MCKNEWSTYPVLQSHTKKCSWIISVIVVKITCGLWLLRLGMFACHRLNPGLVQSYLWGSKCFNPIALRMPKLHRVLAVLSAIGLSEFYLFFFFDISQFYTNNRWFFFQKPASEESCNKSKETKAPEDSVDLIGKERDIKVSQFKPSFSSHLYKRNIIDRIVLILWTPSAVRATISGKICPLLQTFNQVLQRKTLVIKMMNAGGHQNLVSGANSATVRNILMVLCRIIEQVIALCGVSHARTSLLVFIFMPPPWNGGRAYRVNPLGVCVFVYSRIVAGT